MRDIYIPPLRNRFGGKKMNEMKIEKESKGEKHGIWGKVKRMLNKELTPREFLFYLLFPYVCVLCGVFFIIK